MVLFYHNIQMSRMLDGADGVPLSFSFRHSLEKDLVNMKRANHAGRKDLESFWKAQISLKSKLRATVQEG